MFYYKAIRVFTNKRGKIYRKQIGYTRTLTPLAVGLKTNEPNVFADVRTLILEASINEYEAWHKECIAKARPVIRTRELDTEYYCDIPGHEGWIMDTEYVPNRHQRKHGWEGH